MAERIIQTETLQGIANALRGGASQSASDKIEVADFADVAEGLKADETYLKGMIDGSLTSIVIPKGVTTFKYSVFASYQDLTKVTIPNGVTTIGNMAFNNCSNLTEVNIPNSVTTIGTNAFRMCSSLAELNLPNSITSIGSGAFQNIKSDAVINCGFAEGAVSGAPWGAPSTATINYNVTN